MSATSRTDILTAAATLFAAIAAGFSVVAAFRQETATYQSVLYNRQVDAVATFSLAVNAALDRSEVLLKQIEDTVGGAAQGASRTDLRNSAVNQVAEVKRAIEVFTLVFPLEEFATLNVKLDQAVSSNLTLIDTLDNNPRGTRIFIMNPTEALSNYHNLYYRAAMCVPPQLRALVECAKSQLRTGHAVGKQFAHDCAKPTPENTRGSDAADCFP